MFDPLFAYMVRPQLKDLTVSFPLGALRWNEAVDIHEISLPDNHCGMDMAQVEKYVALLRSGVQLMPVLLFMDADNHDRCWLIDGRHRFLANIIVGNSVIEAYVTDDLTMVA